MLGAGPRPPDGQGGARDGRARRRAARRRSARSPTSSASTRTRIPSGVSVGIHATIDELLDAVGGYVDDGYVRIKLKIEPGWDLEPVAAVRRLIGPDTPLQVDANAAYTRDDIDHLARLDEFDLLLIEQPLPEDDLLGHARARRGDRHAGLPRRVDHVTDAWPPTPSSSARRRSSTSSPAGSAATSRRGASTTCAASRGIPVWCGGMLETGIGRAANAALAALDGFTLPGDVSASRRFWARDIVTEPIDVVDGHVAVPSGPGFGVELDRDWLDEVTSSSVQLRDP